VISVKYFDIVGRGTVSDRPVKYLLKLSPVISSETGVILEKKAS